ncbi:helix-turn-helix transcriptional regulator [Solimonas terrae]|uniref:AraC family transcriptional regulator n=1 Tax=Solimonas terrae TaxID=1396819 RepID=A0A6M2BTZ6_9GAMM|nr:AraC family transcriptional regulator [Solimonas terrae]NGY05427.1 AraC family transcriptional regulator [Solimonas terrae]
MPRTPLHEDPIPFITLPNWVKAAALCGFNIQPIFDELGIETDLIHLEEATIQRPLLEQVMVACVERSPGPHFPFVLGETFAFDYLPDIGTFLATSPTLRDAARVFEWVRTLINPLIDVHLEENGAQARLTLHGTGSASGGEVDIYFIESIFAAIVKFGRMLSGDIERFSRLLFRYPAPPHAARYESYFRIPAAFRQPVNAVELPSAQLDAPLGGDFPALHLQAVQRVEQRLARLSRKSGLIAAVESQFEREPLLLGLGIAQMAKRLGLHARTLQRRLRDEGEAYAELQARVRYRLALRDLDNRQLDLETISERLGFSDRRSFTRAFARWSGVSPSQYRSGRG